MAQCGADRCFILRGREKLRGAGSPFSAECAMVRATNNARSEAKSRLRLALHYVSHRGQAGMVSERAPPKPGVPAADPNIFSRTILWLLPQMSRAIIWWIDQDLCLRQINYRFQYH